jgi:hypothetical protein
VSVSVRTKILIGCENRGRSRSPRRARPRSHPDPVPQRSGPAFLQRIMTLARGDSDLHPEFFGLRFGNTEHASKNLRGRLETKNKRFPYPACVDITWPVTASTVAGLLLRLVAAQKASPKRQTFCRGGVSHRLASDEEEQSKLKRAGQSES